MTMKLRTPIVILCLLALLAGCQATSARKAYVGVAGATDAVNGLSDAYQAKLLTKAQLAALAPYADAVLAAQLSLDTAMQKGTPDLSSYFAALTDAVTSLLNAEAVAKRATVKP